MHRRIIRVTACSLVLVLASCGRGDPAGGAVTANIGSENGPGGSVAQNGEVSSAPANVENPQVTVRTSLGDIVIRLDAQKAPITVKNFLWYANNGHYDDTIFHQILDDYVAIGGGYTVDLVEKPTHFTIRNEAFNQLENDRGTIAMARQPDVVDSSTCQFFFNLADNSKLDHKSENGADEFGYCVFGRVIDGWDVVEEIAQVKTADKDGFVSVPVIPVVIHSVSAQ